MNYYTDKCDKILITSTIANTMHVLNFVFDLKYVTIFFFRQKKFWETFLLKRRPKGDQFWQKVS